MKLYLAKFPQQDCSNEYLSALIWPYDANTSPVECEALDAMDGPCEEKHKITPTNQIVAVLPNVEACGYFGPWRGRPSSQAMRMAQRIEHNHILD